MSEVKEIRLAVKVRQAVREDFIKGRTVQYGKLYFIKWPDASTWTQPLELNPDHVKSGLVKKMLDRKLAYVLVDEGGKMVLD